MSLPTPPAATRHARPGWRDPRILIGALIVAASIMAGVKVLSAADNTVGVWAANGDLAPGVELSTEDVVRVQVRFPDADLAARYLSADDALPQGLVLSRTISRGDLLPRSAIAANQATLVRVPLGVEATDVPAGLGSGDRVDVWVAGQESGEAKRVLEDVAVLNVSAQVGSGLGQVVVGVEQATDLSEALSTVAAGRVIITGRG